jgi:hypothetical protein
MSGLGKKDDFTCKFLGTVPRDSPFSATSLCFWLLDFEWWTPGRRVGLNFELVFILRHPRNLWMNQMSHVGPRALRASLWLCGEY